MLRFLLPSLLASVALIGCARTSKSDGESLPPTQLPANSSPEDKLFEQLHSGIFQINAALDSIEEAMNDAKAAKPKSADVKESLDDIVASIDSAGEVLGDEAAVEPVKAEVAKDMAKAEARRKHLNDLLNDSLHDLRDARGIVDSLQDANGVSPLEGVGLKIDVAMDDLRGALEALGGTEVVED